MNIFILSEQTDSTHYQQNAEYHVDRHVVKMIAESCQMLSTAMHMCTNPDIAYISEYLPPITKSLSIGHQSHPCMLWTNASIRHFNYLACMALALCNEHQYRYPLSPRHQYMDWCQVLVDILTDCGHGPSAQLPCTFAVATAGTIHKGLFNQLDAINIYRRYYVQRKNHIAFWKKRMKPVWYMLLEETY